MAVKLNSPDLFHDDIVSEMSFEIDGTFGPFLTFKNVVGNDSFAYGLRKLTEFMSNIHCGQKFWKPHPVNVICLWEQLMEIHR